jgi:hypothetical protein
MEKVTPTIIVWLFLVGATLVETLVFYQDPGGYYAEAAIGLMAAVGAVITTMFSMGLKDEATSVKYVLLVPVLLVAVLVLSMLLAYPVVF